MIQAVLTDIEGTTTSVSFVYETLFPYARRKLAAYIAEHAGDPVVREQLDEAGRMAGETLSPDRAVEILSSWMDADKKITPLKTLQGYIWDQGYRNGEITGHVYDDVPVNLRRWHDGGLSLYVYSSGSVRAQQLLFQYSDHGDLSHLFSGYFDTNIGPKQVTDSYLAIARAIGKPAGDILFLSDVTAELDAASAAGINVLLVDRSGAGKAGRYKTVRTFIEIKLP